MRKVLVLQHVAYEPLGTLDPLLRARRVRIRYVNFSRQPDARPQLRDYDAVVVLGGPMNVGEVERHPHLRTELDLLADATARDMPVLGICLGAQLLAHALGAEVKRNPVKELGWHDVALTAEGAVDPVLSALAPTERIFQWHGDTFGLPPGATLLASSPTCEHQAFRWGKHAYGLQFHLEVDAPLVERWLRVHRSELLQTRGVAAEDAIRRETELRIARSMALSTSLFGRLLEVFGWRGRPQVLALGARHVDE
jgi:GMP synthase (glutamine-hydrolysing)